MQDHQEKFQTPSQGRQVDYGSALFEVKTITQTKLFSAMHILLRI